MVSTKLYRLLTTRMGRKGDPRWWGRRLLRECGDTARDSLTRVFEMSSGVSLAPENKVVWWKFWKR